MSEYRRIGDLVDLIDERNKDEKVKTLIGVSIDKCFIKSVANTIGTDLSKYQVIRKFDFACSLMQVSRDGKIPIACLKDYDEAIMSPAYYIFRIKNTEEILSDYMAMWFMRPEFDREASYIAVGGVRGSMPWEDFCDMKLPVPDIKEQQKIVNTYNAITNRIRIKQKINENLERTAQTIYRKMFIEDADENWKKCKLGTLVEIKRGGSPRPIQDYIQPSGYRWLKISDATASKSPYIFKTEEYISEDGLNKTVLLKAGSLILSNSATPGLPKILRVDSCIHDGWLYFPKSKFSNEYLYLLFQNIREDLKSRGNGSIFTNLKTDILKEYFVYVPDDSSLSGFQDKIEKLFYQMLKNSEELNELNQLKELVISKISKR